MSHHILIMGCAALRNTLCTPFTLEVRGGALREA